MSLVWPNEPHTKTIERYSPGANYEVFRTCYDGTWSKWQAYWRVGLETVFLGYFDSLDAAKDACQKHYDSTANKRRSYDDEIDRLRHVVYTVSTQLKALPDALDRLYYNIAHMTKDQRNSEFSHIISRVSKILAPLAVEVKFGEDE